MEKLIPVIVVFFSLISVYSSYGSAELTCSVKTDCGGEVDVFHIYALNNSHAEIPSSTEYDYKICCGGVVGLGNNCTGLHTVVLRLSNATNAHVEKNTLSTPEYDGNDVCLSLGIEGLEIDCNYGSSCDPGYECLATMSADTNAHVADCDSDYPIKVCCKAVVDITPPTITDDYNYNGTWVNQNQTITLNPQDTESGIKKVKYCESADCTPTILLDSPYKLYYTTDQDTTVRYQAWDNAGNPSNIGEYRVKLDKTPPVTEDNSDTNVHGDGYEVTLTCSDEGSGCKNIYYCVYNNGEPACTDMEEYTAPETIVTLTCQPFSICEKIIRYYSTDNVNNEESPHDSNIITIDRTQPTCTMSVLDEYTKSADLQLKWSGEDPRGEEITGYKIQYKNNSDWILWRTFSGEIESAIFSGMDGYYEFQCQSITQRYPNGGSRSSVVSTFIDTIKPSSWINPLPKWANTTNIIVSWSDDETGSGIDYYNVQYKVTWLNNSPIQDWINWLSTNETSKTIEVEDNHTYYFRVNATDKAGWIGDYSVSEFTSIDLIKPVCIIEDLPDYINTTSFTVNWYGMDSGSEIQYYDLEMSTDNKTWVYIKNRTQDTSYNFQGIDTYTYYFRCMAADNANNTGISSVKSTTIDASPPKVDISYNTTVLAEELKDENLTINTTISDFTDIDSVYLTYNNRVIDVTQQAKEQGKWENLWIISLTTGIYGRQNFTLTVKDIHNNINVTTYFFNVIYCFENQTRPCGSNIGVCEFGERRCVDGLWGEDCTGGINPATEVCDGLDNDCDGLTDEGIDCTCVPGTKQECGTDTGECKKGTQTCGEDGVWGLCTGGINPATEVCDGLDNDCDGKIDEDAGCCITGQTRFCGHNITRGICRPGTATCKDSKWGECIDAVYPTFEICGNNLDDDCDGETDEGCETCNNGIKDGDEEGVDCGGSCSPCQPNPLWFILIIIGITTLIILVIIIGYLKSRGETLTWELLKKKWTPA